MQNGDTIIYREYEIVKLLQLGFVVFTQQGVALQQFRLEKEAKEWVDRKYENK